ncbi:MAG: RluA family pseudouridine synthase [Bacillota bacterium]|nr:RluA family pseudouridine synthase [Bacillota bacterium]
MTNGSGSEKIFVVSAEDEGARLDLFLANLEDGLSRNMVQKLVDDGRVRINQETCYDKNHRIKGGEEISLFIPPPGEISVGPEDIRLDIIYEDSDLLVVNKPRGMVVHPAPGHPGGTLVNALLNHCSDLSGIGGMIRPGIIHRLDKDTSGLLIVAKNDQAHRLLSGQLKSRTLRREYIALVAGKVMPAVGRIEAPIGRHPHHRKKMAVISAGREAVTRYRVLKYYGQYSLLQLNLETGRTHQIRVHLAHLGYPVIGDPTYSKRSYDDLPSGLAAPQALHARRIRFIHPRSGEEMEFSAPLPSDFRKGLIWLSKKYPS